MAPREVLAAAPGTRVVVLTSFAEADQVTAALASGAVGYLLKDCEPDVQVRGIREAADGGALPGTLQFAVFGLGNTQYEHFNAMGIFVDKKAGLYILLGN